MHNRSEKKSLLKKDKGKERVFENQEDIENQHTETTTAATRKIHFTDLPPEMIAEIGANLISDTESNDVFRDLRQFSHTSRSIYSAVGSISLEQTTTNPVKTTTYGKVRERLNRTQSRTAQLDTTYHSTRNACLNDPCGTSTISLGIIGGSLGSLAGTVALTYPMGPAFALTLGTGIGGLIGATGIGMSFFCWQKNKKTNEEITACRQENKNLTTITKTLRMKR